MPCTKKAVKRKGRSSHSMVSDPETASEPDTQVETEDGPRKVKGSGKQEFTFAAMESEEPEDQNRTKSVVLRWTQTNHILYNNELSEYSKVGTLLAKKTEELDISEILPNLLIIFG